jgi:hypothetical protein
MPPPQNSAAAVEPLPPPPKTPPPPQNRCSRCLKPTAGDPLPPSPKTHKFLRLRLYGYNDHDNLDHNYIMIGYLDIDIKNTVYNNSSRDAVDDDKEEKTMETHNFKSSRNCPLHSRYD